MDKNEKENFMYCFKHHAFSLLHKVGIKGKDIKNKLFLYVIRITTSASKKVDTVNCEIKQRHQQKVQQTRNNEPNAVGTVTPCGEAQGPPTKRIRA